MTENGCYVIYAPFSLLMELARLELTGKSGPGGPVRTLPLGER
jgi:hypothetical protein